MRRIAVLAVIAILAANSAEAATSLEQRARSGDPMAQLQMGDSYCDARPGMDARDPKKAMYWWNQAGQNRDKDIAMTAYLSMGTYYLGRFVNLDYYHPDKSKPVVLCHANSKKVRPDYDRAVKYFKKCAALRHHDKSCELALGHLYNEKHDDAKAYYWYATVLAYILDNDFDNIRRYPNRNEILSLDHPGLRKEPMLAYVRKVAERLKPAQVKMLNAEAQAYARGRK